MSNFIRGQVVRAIDDLRRNFCDARIEMPAINTYKVLKAAVADVPDDFPRQPNTSCPENSQPEVSSQPKIPSRPENSQPEVPSQPKIPSRQENSQPEVPSRPKIPNPPENSQPEVPS
ncbi:hypothetical protein ACA910_004793 [Epithemia clementina (nom. ined.)]